MPAATGTPSRSSDVLPTPDPAQTAAQGADPNSGTPLAPGSGPRSTPGRSGTRSDGRSRSRRRSVAHTPSRHGSEPPSLSADDPVSEPLSSPLDFGSERDTTASGMGGRGGGASEGGASSAAPRSDLGPNVSSQPEMSSTVIWGTTINVTEYLDKFREFLSNFMEDGGTSFVYEDYLVHILENDLPSLNLDCRHLLAHDRRMYQQLVQYPQEVVPLMDIAVMDKLEDLATQRPDLQVQRRVLVRPFNLATQTTMRNLDPRHIDTLVSVQGMVTRTSNCIPDLRTAFFQCTLCEASVEVTIDHRQIEEPNQCGECHGKQCMQIVHNRCVFADKQVVRLQEAPDCIPEGETPQTVTALCWDDLVDASKPGDRVVLTGIFRASPARVNPRQRTLKAVYKTYFDLQHVRKAEAGRLRAEDARAAPDDEWHTSFDEAGADDEGLRRKQKDDAEAIAERSDCYEALAAALAPSIWELADVKKGVLCQLFAGTTKALDEDETGGARFRGDLNVLLVGDPGTSKSQLLQYVHKVSPRGVYTSGKGSSAVGLTAYVTRDPETQHFVLESGALVLSDRGVCCIDEFDKMSESARSVLHEVMEQQTVSVAKAGIICSLNARTSILASANPRESRYNPSLSVIENIDLPPTLLSRFDLIYLLLDKPNERTDRQLARHLVGLYAAADPAGAGVDGTRGRSVGDVGAPIDQRTLTDYISYARQHCHPRVTDAAAEQLVANYVEMRRLGASRKTISATPRQLESLIRLAEAHARIHLRSTVEEQDVEEAVRLMRVATQQAATDPVTGTIDMDLIATGRSAAARGQLEQLAAALLDRLRETASGSATAAQLLQAVAETAGVEVTVAQVREALDELKKDKSVAERGASIVLL